jgi:hypothetical protein
VISELALGILYAITGTLTVVLLLLVAFLISGLHWLMKHVKGAVAWNENTVETKLERE